MKQENYPEKIYVLRDDNAEHYDFGIYDTDADFINSCEYTRSDIVEKMIKDAFEGGLKQGVKGGYIIKED